MAENTVDTLKIEVSADAKKAIKELSGLSKVLSEFAKYDKSFDGVQKSADQATESWKRGSKELENLRQRLSKPIDGSIKKAADTTGQLAKKTQEVTRSYDDLVVAGKTFDDLVKGATRNMDAAKKKASEMSGAIQGGSQAMVKTAAGKINNQPQQELNQYLNDVDIVGNGKKAHLNFNFEEWKNAKDVVAKLVPIAKDASDSTEKLAASTEKASASFKNLATSTKIASNASKTLANNAKGFVKLGFDKVANSLRGSFAGLNKQIKYLGSAIKNTLVYSTIAKFFAAINDGVKTGTDNLYQYSKIINGTFAGSMDRLASSLQYLQNSIGAAVAPLINTFAPAIDAAIDKVVEFINSINQLIAKLTGASTWTKAVKVQKEYAEAADSAAAANKNLLAGFDELNVIQSQSSGSSKSTPDYGSMFEEISLDNYVLPDFVQQIKDQIESGDWRGVGETLGEKVNEITSSVNWSELGAKVGDGLQGLIDAYNGFMETVDWTNIGAGLGDALNNLMENIDPASVGAAFAQSWNAIIETVYGFITTTDWTEVGKFIADSISGWFENVNWTLLGQTLAESLRAIFETAVSFVQNFEWSELLSAFKEFVSGFFDTLGIGEVGEFINASVDLIITAIQNLSPVWDKVMVPIGEWTAETLLATLREVSDLIGDITSLLSGDISFEEFSKQLSPIQTVLVAISTAATAVVTAFKLWTTITTVATGVISAISKVSTVASTLGKAFGLLSSPIGIVVAAITGVIAVAALLEEKYGTLTTLTEGVGQKFSEVWGTIKELFAAVGDSFKEVWEYNIKPTLELLKNLFVDVFQGVVILVNSAINGVMDIFKGLLNFVIAVFTGDWKKAIEGICDVFEGVTGIIKGVANAVIAVLVGLLNAVISGVESTINWAANGINKWIGGLGDKVEKLVEFFGGDIDLNFKFNTVSFPRVSVPKLASGGVATGPSLAMIGEYPSAASNPEIVAPQSVIYDTVVSANGRQEQLLVQLINLTRQLVQKETTVTLAPSAALGRVNAKSNQLYAAATGGY